MTTNVSSKLRLDKLNTFFLAIFSFTYWCLISVWVVWSQIPKLVIDCGIIQTFDEVQKRLLQLNKVDVHSEK